MRPKTKTTTPKKVTRKKTGAAKTTTTRKAKAVKEPVVSAETREAFVKGVGVPYNKKATKHQSVDLPVEVQRDCDPENLINQSPKRRLLADLDVAQVQMLLALRHIKERRLQLLLPDESEARAALQGIEDALVAVESAVHSVRLDIKVL